jgi:hypothetical protein
LDGIGRQQIVGVHEQHEAASGAAQTLIAQLAGTAGVGVAQQFDPVVILLIAAYEMMMICMVCWPS